METRIKQEAASGAEETQVIKSLFREEEGPTPRALFSRKTPIPSSPRRSIARILVPLPSSEVLAYVWGYFGAM